MGCIFRTTCFDSCVRHAMLDSMNKAGGEKSHCFFFFRGDSCCFARAILVLDKGHCSGQFLFFFFFKDLILLRKLKLKLGRVGTYLRTKTAQRTRWRKTRTRCCVCVFLHPVSRPLRGSNYLGDPLKPPCLWGNLWQYWIVKKKLRTECVSVVIAASLYCTLVGFLLFCAIITPVFHYLFFVLRILTSRHKFLWDCCFLWSKNAGLHCTIWKFTTYLFCHFHTWLFLLQFIAATLFFR